MAKDITVICKKMDIRKKILEKTYVQEMSAVQKTILERI